MSSSGPGILVGAPPLMLSIVFASNVSGETAAADGLAVTSYFPGTTVLQKTPRSGRIFSGYYQKLTKIHTPW